MPTYGFNLGSSLEATSGMSVPGPAVYTAAAKAGFNAVRIPCKWDTKADRVTHKIDPTYMATVKQAVDRSIAAGMYVVLNDNWDGGWLEKKIGATVDPVIDAKMKAYWTQIATEFAGYENRLLFAAANEPHLHRPADMVTLMAYYQTFVNAVRAVGGNNTKRWLVLQGSGDPSWFATLPSDPTLGRLMVEYHNYEPILFTSTHTDQVWGKAIYFWGAAYHYAGNPSRNAASSLEEGAVDSGFQQLKEQFVDKGIPVMVGEFQASATPNLTGNDALYNRASTLYWNKYVLDSAHAHGLSPFYRSTPDALTDQELVGILTGRTAAPPPPHSAPSAVTGLVATSAGTGRVNLSWNAVAGASSYQLYRTAQSGFEPATPSVSDITGTSYKDIGLNDGTAYYYQVVAVNQSGPSGFSREVHASTPGVNPDPAKFNFETDTQRWSTNGDQIAGIATSSTQHFAGKQSLAVNFDGTTAGTAWVEVSDVVLPVGATVTFHVWVPAGHQVTMIEPYVRDYNWAEIFNWHGFLTPGAWNTFTLTVPATYQDKDNVTQATFMPLKRLGLRITTGAAWAGTIYIDSITMTTDLPAGDGIDGSASSNPPNLSNAASSPSGTSPMPMPTYGFNLGNSLESVWGMTVPGREVYTAAAKAGFNAVRIHCMWDTKADRFTHKIDPIYMAMVKQAVDRSIAAGMYVVLNAHWDGGWFENNIGATVDPYIDEKMKAYWTQIATEFAGYDNRLLFAAANEPGLHRPADMATLTAYYQTFVNAVRAVGGNNTNRWLVLQGSGDPSWFATLPSDPTPGRLMVEYHNYTPSLFALTHTDQTYGKAIHFWGAAYHYAGNPSRNAPSSWEEGVIDSEFQQLKEQFVDKGIPVMVGEFQAGATPNLTGKDALYNRASTLYWNKYVVDSAHAHGLSPFGWGTPHTLNDQEFVGILTGRAGAPPPPNGAPSAVTGLVATSAGTGRVNLSWNAVAGASSYKLYRTAQSGFEPATPSVSGITGTSYKDIGLNDGTTYYYQVVAVNQSGPSGFSREAHASTPGFNPDPTKFNFETGTQRWSTSGAHIAGIATSSAQRVAGKQSLAVNFKGTSAGTASVELSDVVLPVGATVTFHVWVPAGHQVTAIEPYLQDYNWARTAGLPGNLTAGAWNTLTLTVPPTYQDKDNVTQATFTPLKRLGLRIATGAAWTGTIYIDSIHWSTL